MNKKIFWESVKEALFIIGIMFFLIFSLGTLFAVIYLAFEEERVMPLIILGLIGFVSTIWINYKRNIEKENGE